MQRADERGQRRTTREKGAGGPVYLLGPQGGPGRRFRPGSLRAPHADLTEYPATSMVVMSEHAEAGETNYTVL